MARSSDAAIAGQLISNLYLNRTFARDAEDDVRTAELSCESVRDAFRKYVIPEQLIVIRAGDLQK